LAAFSVQRCGRGFAASTQVLNAKLIKEPNQIFLSIAVRIFSTSLVYKFFEVRNGSAASSCAEP